MICGVSEKIILNKNNIFNFPIFYHLSDRLVPIFLCLAYNCSCLSFFYSLLFLFTENVFIIFSFVSYTVGYSESICSLNCSHLIQVFLPFLFLFYEFVHFVYITSKSFISLFFIVFVFFYLPWSHYNLFHRLFPFRFYS